MIVKNVTRQDLQKALDLVNGLFSGNVIWNRAPEYIGRDRYGHDKLRLTLRVKDSRGPGARLSIPHLRGDKQRHLISACWHVHGHFYDALPPEAVIQVSIRDGMHNISPGDRWHDWDCGSRMHPAYMSELCECD